MMFEPQSKLALIGTALATAGLGVASAAVPAARAAEATVASSTQSAPLLAQVDSCRQVTTAIRGLNVRQGPTLSSNVIGVVPGGTDVTLADRGQNGWAPIVEPFNGYVSTSYLVYCPPAVGGTVSETPVAVAPDMCRQVIVRTGLNVRAQPTVYSARVGALPTGTNVTVTGAEVNNWLPISEPIDGYVAARFVGAC